VELKALDLSLEERLQALRRLDIFHPWESVDERRLCRRCREIINGRQIKIWSDRPGGEPAHLECPSKGCLAVPLEWIMLDSPAEQTQELPPPNQPTGRPVELARVNSPKNATLGFLRVPPLHF
jgi:hypothetical protein